MHCTEAQTIVYQTTAGKIFTSEQRDSIERAGNIIYLNGERHAGDTIYRGFSYFDRKLWWTPFQRKHVGSKFPNFSAASIRNTSIDSTFIKGRIAVLNFWSVTCSPCIAEMPQLNALRGKYSDRVAFVAIAPDTREQVFRLLERHQFDFEILADQQSLINSLGIDAFPSTLIVDKDGKVVWAGQGVLVKTNPDGTIANSNGTTTLLVFETYANIIEDLLKR